MYLDQEEENLGVRLKLIRMVILFLENGEYAMIIVPLKRQKLVGLYKTQILCKVISEKNPNELHSQMDHLDGFCDLLGTWYAPFLKIPPVKTFLRIKSNRSYKNLKAA